MQILAVTFSRTTYFFGPFDQLAEEEACKTRIKEAWGHDSALTFDRITVYDHRDCLGLVQGFVPPAHPQQR